MPVALSENLCGIIKKTVFGIINLMGAHKAFEVEKVDCSLWKIQLFQCIHGACHHFCYLCFVETSKTGQL